MEIRTEKSFRIAEKPPVGNVSGTKVVIVVKWKKNSRVSPPVEIPGNDKLVRPLFDPVVSPANNYTARYTFKIHSARARYTALALASLARCNRYPLILTHPLIHT